MTDYEIWSNDSTVKSCVCVDFALDTNFVESTAFQRVRVPISFLEPFPESCNSCKPCKPLLSREGRKKEGGEGCWWCVECLTVVEEKAVWFISGVQIIILFFESSDHRTNRANDHVRKQVFFKHPPMRRRPCHERPHGSHWHVRQEEDEHCAHELRSVH